MKRMFIRFSLACIVLMGTAFAAGPWISTSPTVAGRDVPVRVSGLLEYENLALTLVRPDTSKIPLTAAANDLGVASFFINGLHVRQAGGYELLVRREQSSSVQAEQFEIAPASVSAYRSQQSVDIQSLAADGEQVARIRVQVKDPHGNLIMHAPVRAFSSRAEDSVIIAPQTNAQGEVVVKVSSSTPGVSTISVLAGEVLLFERTELIFHLAEKGILGIGASGFGEFLQTQLFEDPEESVPAAYFSIEDIGSEVVAGQNLTARIGAKDADGELVKNYTGTVRFSSSDDRAVLPNDYTFVSEDQGWHTFYLSVMLQTPGMQSIAVHDLGDFRITGERNITVSDGSGVVAVPDPEAEVTIDVPINGSTFSSSRITISGSATGVSLVRLTDGITELIGELPVDTSGKYVYQTPRLADGIHIFQANSVEDSSVVSNIVQVTIDRSPPEVVAAEFMPAGPVAPGADVILRIEAAGDLSAVICDIAEQRHELQPEDSKVFSGVITAPFEPGEYPVECTMVDLLGNEITNPDAGSLVVVGFEGTVELIPEGMVLPLTDSIIYVRSLNELATVDCDFLGKEYALETEDFKNFSADIQAPATPGAYPVECLMTDPQGIETTDTKQLIVGNLVVSLDPDGTVLPLTNSVILTRSFSELSSVNCEFLGQVYVLATEDSKNFSAGIVAPSGQGTYSVDCVGIDLEGNEMTDTKGLRVGNLSMELDPEGIVPPLTDAMIYVRSVNDLSAVNCNFVGQIHALQAEDSKNFSKGIVAPETQGVYPVECVGIDLQGNATPETKYLIVESDEEVNIAPLPVSNIHTAPGEKLVTVFWSPAVDDKGIKNYRVNFGLIETALTGVNFTPDARTQWYVNGLDPCVEVYFQVTPIDEEGLEGASSLIVPGTPFCDQVEHPAPPASPATGGNTSWWFAIFSIIAGFGIMILFRRRV